MRRYLSIFAVAAASTAIAHAESLPSAPFRNGEVLNYEIVWSSGLPLGEARFSATAHQAGWSFEARLTASIPVITVEDNYSARSDHALCSVRFEKEVAHGPRRQHEEVEFDQQANTALRRNLLDGTTQALTVPPCARDALAYLYYLRQDLSQGRVPPPDDLNFGTQMQITTSYLETRMIEVAGRRQEADRLLVDITAGADPVSIEIFLAKDEARTPLLVRVPFALGTFSLRLKQ